MKCPGFFLTLLILFSFSPAFSQPVSDPDSLIKAIHDPSLTDSLRVRFYNRLTKHFTRIEASKAEAYSDSAIELAEKIHFISGKADALNNKGVIYNSKGDYEKALSFYYASLKLFEESGYKYGIARAYNNLGGIYYSRHDYNRSLDFYRRSLEIKKQIKDLRGTAATLNNMGNVYYSLKEPQKSLEYRQQALKIYEQIADPSGLSVTLNNIGMIYTDMSDFETALIYYFKGLDIKRKLNEPGSIAITLINIGTVYINAKQYPKADKYFNEALEIAQRIGAKAEIKDAYYGLAVNAQQQKDYEKAYNYLDKYAAIKDSIFNEESSMMVAEIQTKYETEKKEQEIVLLNKDKELQATKIKRQKTVNYSIWSGLILFIFFSGFLYNRIKITRKQKQIIEDQKVVVEEKNKEITASMHYARRIQKALFASEKLLDENLPEYFILNKPRDIVSGDFYWASSLRSGPHKGRFIFGVCDCTGHGVPGAFMSLLNISLLNETVIEREIVRPDEILNEVREKIITVLNPEGTAEESRDGMDAVLCSIDHERTTLIFACANNPLWLVRGNELIVHKPDKYPVGMHQGELSPFTLNSVQLQKGDTIYIFSDGYADQFGGHQGKKFKREKLKELIFSNREKPLKEQRQILEETFDTWKSGYEQVDDVLVMGIRI